MPVPPDILAAVVGGLVVIVAGVAVIVWRRRRSAGRVAARGSRKIPRSPATLLRDGLGKTRHSLLARLQAAWSGDREAAARLSDLEEALLSADVGLKTTQALLAKMRPRLRELVDAESLRDALREEMRAMLSGRTEPAAARRPWIVLVVGVNGVGKTTTIGKLAHRYRQDGKTVLLVAADTFRAAASEQLQKWAERAGADCVHHQSGSDPSAVVYDGIAAATARAVDVAIIDTAGRLHVKTHLIEELKKIVRTIGRQLPGSPHEILLVIDATTGQNAINQARVFQEALSLTGIVLTKLDGTAKGGAVFTVRDELGVPIRYVGLGEGVDDLIPFDAGDFVDALLPRSGDTATDSAA